MPRSSATRRATGVMGGTSAPPPNAGAGSAVLDGAGAAGGGGANGATGEGAAAAGAGEGAATAGGAVTCFPLPFGAAVAPAWAIDPITWPTFTTSPSWASIFSMAPAAGAGTSTVTLSVSSTTTGSSTATLSPTFLCHFPTVASVMDSPSAGTLSSTPIPGSSRHGLLDDQLLLELVRFGEPGGRAGSFDPPDVAHQQRLVDLPHHLLQARQYERPGAHVSRLLLHPVDLLELGVSLQHLDQLL